MVTSYPQICHGAWLVALLLEYLAKGMKAVLVHLLEHLCQFFFTISTTLTRRKSSESGITLCLQWGMRNVRNKRMNSKFLHMFVHNINRKICEITNLLNWLQIHKGGNVRPEIMNRLKGTKRSLPA